MIRPFPSVDLVARSPLLASALEVHGRSATLQAIREVARARRERAAPAPDDEEIAREVGAVLERRARPALRRVFNLTGVVLHTNLGRAQLSERAVEQAALAMREAVNLEFDLETGGRGERDDLVEALLTGLTGAEAATVVNNNAAAVLLVLAALAAGREAVVSRGELVEIGGAFRIPDVMRTAGARLVEVGTTNRTHPRDYEAAIGAETALLMKVHASNYRIEGFTASASDVEVADIAHARGLPFVVDLGAGSVVDLSRWGLPKEPTVQEALSAGADLVTFSGDKLMGGPQCGLIVGRRDLIERLRRHPLKRALRVGKPTLAALEATLQAYRTPERLASDLPTLRLLTRPLEEIEAVAARLTGPTAAALGGEWRVETTAVKSQVGSGSLPLETLPSAALAVSPVDGKVGGRLDALAARLRALPIPVVGRIHQDRLLLDLRCLEDEAAFLAQLDGLQRG